MSLLRIIRFRSEMLYTNISMIFITQKSNISTVMMSMLEDVTISKHTIFSVCIVFLYMQLTIVDITSCYTKATRCTYPEGATVPDKVTST